MESIEFLGIKITPGTVEEFCQEISRLIALDNGRVSSSLPTFMR